MKEITRKCSILSSSTAFRHNHLALELRQHPCNTRYHVDYSSSHSAARGQTMLSPSDSWWVNYCEIYMVHERKRCWLNSPAWSVRATAHAYSNYSPLNCNVMKHSACVVLRSFGIMTALCFDETEARWLGIRNYHIVFLHSMVSN